MAHPTRVVDMSPQIGIENWPNEISHHCNPTTVCTRLYVFYMLRGHPEGVKRSGFVFAGVIINARDTIPRQTGQPAVALGGCLKEFRKDIACNARRP